MLFSFLTENIIQTYYFTFWPYGLMTSLSQSHVHRGFDCLKQCQACSETIDSGLPFKGRGNKWMLVSLSVQQRGRLSIT